MRCPVTGQRVKIVDEAVIRRLNTAIAAGGILNRIGEQVDEPVESGLTNEDENYLFPIRSEIVTMVSEELIELNQPK